MTARALIPADDLARIFRAAKAEDYPVQVRIAPDRTIDIIPCAPANDSRFAANPWDDDDEEAVATNGR